MADIIKMPKLGFDMAEGTLVRWVKKVGETVNKGDVLAEIETDKATVEVESSASGVVRRLLVDERTVVPVNSAIAIVGTAEEEIKEQGGESRGQGSENEERTGSSGAPGMTGGQDKVAEMLIKVPVLAPVGEEAMAGGGIKASPLAKKIARVEKVDLTKVRGSGPGGRIVRRDVEAAIGLTGLTSPTSLTGLAGHGDGIGKEDKTIGMSKLRQAIARRMAEAKTSIPHFYVSHEYKLDALMDLRVQYNKIVPENEKISVNDFIVKAVALTLRQFPNLNASILGNSIVQHGQVNIGIAVSVEGGLLTVVCHAADQKSLRQISAEVKAMAANVRAGKVRPEEIEGSTFSISNLGMYDVENFAAIINPPEAGILAVGSAREVPVVDGDIVKPGWRMKATISVDHRVSDGVEGAKFMQALAVYLEEPLRLLM
jgi:pyruvate dehydrogenase E2 component (dihydrolipoamide acetyltransferase)